MNNNRKKIINMALIGAIITGGAAVTVGCDKEDEFSVVWNDELEDGLSLQPGESVLLYAARDDEKAGTISYVITEGSAYATISNTGVLTVTKAAEVGQKIKVQAVSDDVKSSEIVVTVVAVKEIQLTTTATSTTLERGDSATLNVNYKNSEDTVENVTYRITAGSEYATLNNNVLTVKSDAEDGATITVMAETPITSTNTLTFTVNVPEVEIKYIVDVDNSTITVDSTSTTNTVAIAPKVLDIDNSWQEVQLEASDLDYEVISGEEYVSVNNEGYLTAIGHGQAVVRVSYDSNDPLVATATRDITVNAILPPETINLGTMFTYQLNNLNKGAKLGFGINSSNGDNAKLNLGITGVHTTATHFAETYKVNIYVDGATTPSTGYATYNNADKSLTFNEIAIGHTLRVEVLTDTGASKETRSEFTIDVNAGYNIYELDDLFSSQRRVATNITVNLLVDCIIEGDSNTIANGQGMLGYKLHYYGNTSIYGNGYKIDFSRVNNTYSGGGHNFLTLTNIGYETQKNVINDDMDVKIYDLSLYGNNGYNKAYDGDNVKVSPTKGSYDMAIVIEPTYESKVMDYLAGVENAEQPYHSYVNMNNININGFQTGMRVLFANSKAATEFTEAKTSKISNIVVDNCLESGIETVASILTFENVKLGRMGTTGIETTPDIWWTAGENFNEPQKITFKGNFVSEGHNAFNNTYVGNNSDLAALPLLINQIAAGLHQNVSIGGSNVEIAFEAFVVETLKETANAEGVNAVNLVSLLFNNTGLLQKVGENPVEKGPYIKELLNGTILQFEDLQGEATNINNQLAALGAELAKPQPDIEGKCKDLILGLFNSRFISLNVPSDTKVDSTILASIGQLKAGGFISEADYNFLTSKLIEGADINIGSIIVENPLYGVYTPEQLEAVQSPAQLLAMIQVQTVTLG